MVVVRIGAMMFWAGPAAPLPMLGEDDDAVTAGGVGPGPIGTLALVLAAGGGVIDGGALEAGADGGCAVGPALSSTAGGGAPAVSSAAAVAGAGCVLSLAPAAPATAVLPLANPLATVPLG